MPSCSVLTFSWSCSTLLKVSSSSIAENTGDSRLTDKLGGISVGGEGVEVFVEGGDGRK